MSPAFSSPRQAAALALLLALILASPVLMARTGWLARRDVYPAIAWKYGEFPWIQQQIFVETGDVDIALLGSSHLWSGINTPYVQQKLSEQLGREAEVFTLGWPWAGFDALYVIARDLLDHRRVHTLVIYDEVPPDFMMHRNSSHWFRIGEQSEALDGLPWDAQAQLYGGAVLGMPRHLLSMARPNLLEDPARCSPNYWNERYCAPNLAEQRGALKARLAYNYSRGYAPCHAQSAATPEDALIYSAESRSAFHFAGPAIDQYQLHFATKLARLCQERGTQLVVLHLPLLNELGQKVITERHEWPELLGAPVEIVGIPPAKLFAGIPASEVAKFFFDDLHLNQSGQEMFTPLITPALLKLYANSTISH